MLHGTVTVITRVRGKKELEKLRECLARVDQDKHAIFDQVEGLHFARFAIIDRDPDTGASLEEGAQLLFAADFGSEAPERALAARFLDQFVRGLSQNSHHRFLLDRVYRCCEGYPEEPSLAAYLRRHQAGWHARHVAFPYRAQPRDTVRAVLRLREDVEGQLNDGHGPGDDSDAQLEQFRERLKLKNAPLFDGQAYARMTERRRFARRTAARATVVYPVFWAVTETLLLLRRVQQRLSPAVARLERLVGREPKPQRPDPDLALPSFPEEEAQTPMVHVASIQSPIIKLAVITGLRAVNCRLSRYLVGLNRFPNIHCARWFVREKQVFFLSNYDGSFVDYITAFDDEDDLSKYLNLMWSQTTNFPVNKDVKALLGWISNRQFRPQVWYSAYAEGRPVSTVEVQQAFALWELLAQGSTGEFRAYLQIGKCEPEYIRQGWVEALASVLRRDEHVAT